MGVPFQQALVARCPAIYPLHHAPLPTPPFQQVLENPHVIKPSQLMVG